MTLEKVDLSYKRSIISGFLQDGTQYRLVSNTISSLIKYLMVVHASKYDSQKRHLLATWPQIP